MRRNLPLSRILSPQVTALCPAQFPGYNSMGYTDLYRRVASVGIEPGTLRTCRIYLYAHNRSRACGRVRVSAADSDTRAGCRLGSDDARTCGEAAQVPHPRRECPVPPDKRPLADGDVGRRVLRWEHPAPHPSAFRGTYHPLSAHSAICAAIAEWYKDLCNSRCVFRRLSTPWSAYSCLHPNQSLICSGCGVCHVHKRRSCILRARASRYPRSTTPSRPRATRSTSSPRIDSSAPSGTGERNRT